MRITFTYDARGHRRFTIGRRTFRAFWHTGYRRWAVIEIDPATGDNVPGPPQHFANWPTLERTFVLPLPAAIVEADVQTALAHSLTAEEHAALREYAARHGRYWKQDLRDAWMTASEPGILQQLRNARYFGPRGLTQYEVPRG